MTPVLSKDIWCHMTILFLRLKITKSDIRLQVKWTVNLVIIDHLNVFLRGRVVWEKVMSKRGGREVLCGMYGLTYSLYHQRVDITHEDYHDHDFRPNVKSCVQIT